MNFKTLTPIIFIIMILSVLSGCTSNNGTNGDSWIKEYTPVHNLGTGPDDFWMNYPSGNPLSGQNVEHLSWINDSLKTKPVLFVVHRTGCIGCADQAERVMELGERYEEEAKFYDLDAVYDASSDILQKANEVYMYDPNGPPGYIALTGIYTYVKENGEVKIGWHTWEAPNDMTVSDSDLETWIKDAIYYYNINK
jgi:hypothetical protein